MLNSSRPCRCPGPSEGASRSAPRPRAGLVLLAALAWSAALLAGSAIACEDLPSRFTKPKQDKAHVRVVGIGSGTDLPQAQAAAAVEATARLLEYLGPCDGSETSPLRAELEMEVLQLIHRHEPDSRIKDRLLEEWTWCSGDAGSAVHALVRYPIRELDEQRQRLLARREQRIGELEADLDNARVAAEDGEVGRSAFRYARIVGEAGRVPGADALAARARRGLEEVFSSLRLSPADGDGQTGTHERGLPRQLVVEVRGPDGRPARGIPLRFAFETGEGELVSSATTDESGRAACLVSRIDPGTMAGVVGAAVDLRTLVSSDAEEARLAMPPGAVAAAGRARCAFDFAVERPARDLRVLVLVEERDAAGPRADSRIAAALQEQLWERGYRVVGDVEIGKRNCERLAQLLDKRQLLAVRDELYAMVDAVVWGTATAGPAEAVSAGLFCVFANLELKVVDLREGELLATVTRRRVKGFDGTAERAADSALSAAVAEAGPELMRRLDAGPARP